MSIVSKGPGQSLGNGKYRFSYDISCDKQNIRDFFEPAILIKTATEERHVVVRTEDIYINKDSDLTTGNKYIAEAVSISKDEDSIKFDNGALKMNFTNGHGTYYLGKNGEKNTAGIVASYWFKDIINTNTIPNPAHVTDPSQPEEISISNEPLLIALSNAYNVWLHKDTDGEGTTDKQGLGFNSQGGDLYGNSGAYDTTMSDGWHNVIMILAKSPSGSSLPLNSKIYLDGELISNEQLKVGTSTPADKEKIFGMRDTSNNLLNTNSIAIGNIFTADTIDNRLKSNFVTMNANDIRVYPGDLTENEVKQLYNLDCATYGKPKI